MLPTCLVAQIATRGKNELGLPLLLPRKQMVQARLRVVREEQASMTRRGFIKALLALSASRAVPIPRSELLGAARMYEAFAIGTIFHMLDAQRGTVYVMVTDNGLVELEGGELRREHFPKLFDLIGYQFGGEGETFGLPDMRAYAQRQM